VSLLRRWVVSDDKSLGCDVEVAPAKSGFLWVRQGADKICIPPEMVEAFADAVHEAAEAIEGRT